MTHNEQDVERVAKALFAGENCGKSDDVDDRWETCLDPDDRAEYRTLARAALDAMALPPAPQTVGSVEELNTAPVGTILLDANGRLCRATHDGPDESDVPGERWLRWSIDGWEGSALTVGLPATVLTPATTPTIGEPR